MVSGPVALSNPVTLTNPSTTTFGIPVVTNITAMQNPARLKVLQSATATSIANSATTFTPITFPDSAGEITDTAGGHSISVNPAQYVAQATWAGVYDVTGKVSFVGNATGGRWIGLAVNGVTPNYGDVVGWGTVPNSGVWTGEVHAPVFLNVGDYVQLVAAQTSGGALLTNITTLITSSLELVWRSVA